MHDMSVPAPPKASAKRTGKRITFFSEQTMKEASQHPQDYYLPSGNIVDPGQSEAARTVTSNTEGHHNMYLNSVIFSPDKGDQSRGGHYQQTVPMKWTQQEPMQQPQQRQQPWTSSMANWASNYANFMGDARGQGFGKPMLEHNQQQANASQGFQDIQQQQQQHGGNTSSVLQPFQLAFGQPKTQHLPSYYQAFQGNRATATGLPNPPSYQSKPALQAPPQHHHLMQHHAMHMVQSQPAQQQQQPQPQQQQQQQGPREQKIHVQHLQNQHLSQQNVHDFFPSAQQQQQQVVVVHTNSETATVLPTVPQKVHEEPLIQDITPEPLEHTQDPLEQIQQNQSEPGSPQLGLRRSRRLSKEGGAPSSENPFLVSSFPPEGTQNGAPTGVIQSTRRKRRVSQEVNLETLAQKASEMESLPSNFVKDPHRPWSPTEQALNSKRSRDEGLVPLVIPVSVPVRRPDSSPESHEEPALNQARTHRDLGRPDHKPSVIVTRRRSLRNSLSDSSDQNGGIPDGAQDDDPKKSKRRPRPEPLFIPPPKPSLFIAPPVYSSITSYQSHLRSPVRLADNPLTLPPYTPPPILSPVREGSGLYFSTFLSSAAAAAASAQGLPPPTPKSATRSLLRSNSSDITPPVLTSIGEATPVSLEPRINIGLRYQAEIPELRPRMTVEQDQHKAELVWTPHKDLEENHSYQQKVQDLMHLACSSVFSGGGTNQELAHHCLFQCRGDVLAALSLMMLKNPVFPKSHHLSNYHYSGCDNWSAAERRQFNKGIAAHKKDFFMVQKQVCTKSVAQCVEFYYTFKKHVKIGRNGTLLYGEIQPEARGPEEYMDPKGSQQLEAREEDSRKWEGSADRKQEVAHTFQPTDNNNNPGSVLIMQTHEEQPLQRVLPQSLPPHPLPKPRFDPQPRKPSPNSAHKGTAPPAQEGEFPCKKCGRIFYKVKSRSAHMKSHAEQEKKAAALRQREAEERARVAAMLAQRHNGTQRQTGGDSTNDESTDGEDDQDWH